MTLKLKIEVFKVLLIDLEFSSGNKKPKEEQTHATETSNDSVRDTTSK